MVYREDKSSSFAKGALIGGLLAGGLGLLLAPKSGRELRDDIIDTYDSITEKTQSLTDDIMDSGSKLFGKAQTESFLTSQSPFVIGAVLGGILAAVAALLLAPESGKKLRSRLGDQYEDIIDRAETFVHDVNTKGRSALEHVEDWKDTLGTIIDKLSATKKRRSGGANIEDIVEWAGLGLKVIQKLQRR